MTLPTWDQPQRVSAPYSEPLVVILGDFKKFCQNLQRPITRSTHAFSCKLHRVGPPKTQQQRVHAEPKFGSAHCIFMGKSYIGGEQHRRGRRYFSVRWTMVEQFITMHINIFSLFTSQQQTTELTTVLCISWMHFWQSILCEFASHGYFWMQSEV